jgi:uncharacterized repeat protein (TIGR03803 family)
MEEVLRAKCLSVAVQAAMVFLPMSGGAHAASVVPQTLYSLTGDPDGSLPNAGLVRDIHGNFFGTTYYGGAFNLGVVYKITPKGEETVLHSFTGGADGAYPAAVLFAGSDGTLYGTTEYGGSGNCTDSQGIGCGTVFKISETGVEAVLYSFQGGNDGWVPDAGVIQASDGDLYGTTNSGGAYNSGTVFHLTLAGTENVLHTFNSQVDGAAPGGLVQGNDSALYATDGADLGAIFRITTTGVFTTLYQFGTNPDDPAFPIGTITKAHDGAFYGSAPYGGAYGFGAIFAVTEAGKVSIVYSFTGGDDGSRPNSTLLVTDGKIYGTTPQGGTAGYGTLFELTKKGVDTTLYTYPECEDAGGIQGVGVGMVTGTDGYAYGVNVGGCSNDDPYGSVYRFKLPN